MTNEHENMAGNVENGEGNEQSYNWQRIKLEKDNRDEIFWSELQWP